MKKHLFISILLITFNLSFSELIKLPNGPYEFKTLNNESIVFIVHDDILKLVGEDNTEIYLNLLVDESGNHFYHLKDKRTGGFVTIYFNDPCTALIETSKNKFLLYSSNPNCK